MGKLIGQLSPTENNRIGSWGEESDHRQELVRIAALLVIALGIGIYLIATTVLIAKDGALYIELAQEFSHDPVGVMRHGIPFGYPVLIWLTHKCAAVFTDSLSVFVWIYSAQSATGLCRVLALIPLYFIGKSFVGASNAFWSILILIILPYPTKFGADVLRDWPHILFLATGFLFLLRGAERGIWWMFGGAGLTAGLGHMVRPECAQLVIYGALWLLVRLFLPKHGMNKLRVLCALLILLVGFAIPAAPYMKVRGRILPLKLKALLTSSCSSQSERIQEPDTDNRRNTYAAGTLPANRVVRAFGRLVGEICDDLMYFFVPPLLIGLYCRFSWKPAAASEERFFITAFISLNIVILTLLHHNWGYISRRHSLPLVVLTIFYIPIGLDVIARWLSGMGLRDGSSRQQERQPLFLVLLAVGVAICLPKLLRPLRIEKQGYRAAANWLMENTAQTDLIASPDRRISFYAERKGLIYDDEVPKRATYVVKISKDIEEVAIEEEMPGAEKVFSGLSDDEKTCDLIYDLRKCVSERVSFVDYHWQKIVDEKYKFSFVFKVNIGFEKDWMVYFHGSVKEENIGLLPKKRQEYKYDNWDFGPKPATSDWPKNEYITITREISAKPIPYNLSLGFFTPKEGRHGRRIDLGWVDLGSAQQENGN